MYVRSPNLAAYWEGESLILEEFRARVRLSVSPVTLELLDAFSRPARPSDVARRFSGYTGDSVRRQIETLRRWKLLQRAKRSPATDLASKWRGSFAAAHYHFTTRDLSYITEPLNQSRHAGRFLLGDRPPSLYKIYRSKPRLKLPTGPSPAISLHNALAARRTIRRFRRSPASARDVGSILRGTWGQTGWLESSIFGKLVRKSSPSGGSRHPIECYLIAWNVEGLARGVYHYNVRDDVVELLKAGDFRDAAVEIASGHEWVRDAAFLCVMTAVADRTFWKYRSSKAYAIFLLDAGHLGQTFLLLAAAHGLGGFTTAAIQHTRAEKLIRLDGVTEFPVYLCGAGTPDLEMDPRRPVRAPSRRASRRSSRG